MSTSYRCISPPLPSAKRFSHLLSRRPVKLAGAALTCDAVTLDVT
jgi:hypothetical protein